jgi:phosphoenolpyruvate carboxylase
MPDHVDFEHSLPDGRDNFTVRYLARLWDCSEDSVQRLIEEGSLKLAITAGPAKCTRSMQRVTRQSVVVLLNSRKSGTFRRQRRRSLRTE